jgi:hypothetical protein
VSVDFFVKVDFSADISFGSSNSKTVESTKTYSFDQSVNITVPPGKARSITLMACILENIPLNFVATLEFDWESGRKNKKTMRGTWEGTTYANYHVVVNEE